MPALAAAGIEGGGGKRDSMSCRIQPCCSGVKGSTSKDGVFSSDLGGGTSSLDIASDCRADFSEAR